MQKTHFFFVVACRRFTPLLRDFYIKLKSRSDVEDFEVLYCSMDRSDAEFQKYAAEMPWWCLPYKSPVLGKLANLYECQGIPHLVILDRDGTVLVPDGVGEVATDPDGQNFPWRPKPLVDLLPPSYLASDRSLRPMSELDQKYLMLYFSAHWCPPCQQFTPKLNKAYKALKAQRDDFELLFVSSDHDPDAFEGYFAEMAFCALPYEEREAKAAIANRLQVRGIPCLCIFGPKPDDRGDRPLINRDVRYLIEGGDYLAEFPFYRKPYGDLNTAQDNINSIRSIIVFHEAGDDEEQHQVVQALKKASELYKGREETRFYWATMPTGLTTTVRDALKLGPVADLPLMVLLDIPNGGSYYVSDLKEVSPESVIFFISAPGERRLL